MDLVVILLFVAMVLAPCVVALRSRVHSSEDQDEAAVVAEAVVSADATPLVEANEKPEPRRALATLFAADGPIARKFRKVEQAFAASREHQAETEPLPATCVADPVAVPLENLLQEAIESACVARAASLRADAAASEVVARMAAVRAEAAAEEARRAHLDANAAEQAALSAHAAYETAKAQAEEPKQAMRLVSDRRAA